MVGLRRPVQRSEAGRSKNWVSFFEELETMEHLWKDYGKIYGKDGKIYGRDGKSTEHMENLWKTGDRNHGTPPNPMVYDHLSNEQLPFYSYTMLYRCTPFSDAAIRHIFFYSQSIGETLRYFGLCSHAHSARVRNWNFTLTIYWLTNLHSPLLYNGLGHIPRYNTSYWNTFLNAQKGIISSVKASISGFDNFATSQLQCGWWFQGLNLIL